MGRPRGIQAEEAREVSAQWRAFVETYGRLHPGTDKGGARIADEGRKP